MSRAQRQALDAKLRAFTPVFDADQTQQDRLDAIAGARAGFAAIMSTMQVPTGFSSEDVELGAIRTLKIEPTHNARPGIILYFHGGSFIAGSPETAIGLTAELVVRSGYTAYSVDYALAPEHPFPAGIDDTTAAYRALLEAGNDPSSIAFAGDSAGGGLTITTLIRARQQGLPMPQRRASTQSSQKRAFSQTAIFTAGMRTQIKTYFRPLPSQIRPASHHCFCRWGRTRFSSMTPSPWLSAPATPEWTSSST